MRTHCALVLVAVVGTLGCSKAGLESQECKDYFAKVEACAAKAPAIKADALRKTADVSEANFEKNANPLAVKKSCEMMLDTLNNDPDCK